MKKKTLILLLLAVALVLTSFIHSASAYFTTYTEAKGGYTINLEGERKIEEDFYDWTKHVRITSTGGEDCYVRARAFAPSGYELIYTGDNWTLGDDGWYYYNEILPAGGTTEELLVEIKNIPEDPSQNDNFDVVVVYECTPVLYDANGQPYADWSNYASSSAERGN